MNARIASLLPALGQQVEGGYFHGILLLNNEIWAEVTAPRDAGEISGLAWLTDHVEVPGATSDFDGLANTKAMAEAGSPLAKAVQALTINGFNDWYIPARGSQLMQWSLLKAPNVITDAYAFDLAWYWSSTQFSRLYAYLQDFDYGDTNFILKAWESGRARAVRRFRIE